jgi:hypothetical protein
MTNEFILALGALWLVAFLAVARIRWKLRRRSMLTLVYPPGRRVGR